MQHKLYSCWLEIGVFWDEFGGVLREKGEKKGLKFVKSGLKLKILSFTNLCTNVSIAVCVKVFRDTRRFGVHKRRLSFMSPFGPWNYVINGSLNFLDDGRCFESGTLKTKYRSYN